ncbi:bifunctional folylpolyglutamate synthase/dihydrofolate synthase [Clostridium septicum]|uniref:tetrahydrofolate synthase n=1 Tax=Clostridium septicum TaxID=1504 RepID=A0A9N7PLJ9_CLOSE|nr:folylpolyglutamate synthase/dihydrofolate synthase family protein [Clostridium septicum]AYE35532.1 bifunctional folylpolyglutamate synthase/dihydrofolate synthase [Clostridium septicum]MDU1314586.1 folylpolyglutamate synthase/dihydrofolate synthase family protein [Clostridium septicum]QAS60919.1 bifunctional folylpolyglutamate synthase/dihydrofolate synthase [Clostridium septicum]UEC19807.1 bifunctional folylpolyglutamate synthase/dihydrofolate synthase [Clostridium septicum]USS02134.1 bifu
MKYEDAMKYITEVGNFGSNYGLERTYRLLELLDNPQEKINLIHIAGTNGKGSTTAIISRILQGHGYKVGMYTSPFLEEFEERIQINGMNIPKEKLADLMEKVKKAVDKVIEEGYNHPTEFEIITCLMYLYFYIENVDFGVIEVGLGGRLDSTNVITPILSVITSISLDHVNILGNSLKEIANEKSGIIKNKVPVVIFPQKKDAFDIIKKKCEEENASLYVIDENDWEFIDVVREDGIYQKIRVKYNKEELEVNFPLLGEHQILNLSVALKAIEILEKNGFLKISKEIIKKSLESVVWKGRLEVMNVNPLVVIDGAHNIQGITTLKSNIKKYFEYRNLYLILGILADKDVERMVKEITPMAKKVYSVTPNSLRAELSEDLKKEILKYNSNCYAYEDYEEALNSSLKDATEEDLIIASGSLYMIADMRKIITNKFIKVK